MTNPASSYTVVNVGYAAYRFGAAIAEQLWGMVPEGFDDGDLPWAESVAIQAIIAQVWDRVNKRGRRGLAKQRLYAIRAEEALKKCQEFAQQAEAGSRPPDTEIGKALKELITNHKRVMAWKMQYLTRERNRERLLKEDEEMKELLKDLRDKKSAPIVSVIVANY